MLPLVSFLHEFLQPKNSAEEFNDEIHPGLATRFAKGYRLLTLNRLFNRFVVTGTGTDSKNE